MSISTLPASIYVPKKKDENEDGFHGSAFVVALTGWYSRFLHIFLASLSGTMEARALRTDRLMDRLQPVVDPVHWKRRVNCKTSISRDWKWTLSFQWTGLCTEIAKHEEIPYYYCISVAVIALVEIPLRVKFLKILPDAVKCTYARK